MHYTRSIFFYMILFVSIVSIKDGMCSSSYTPQLADPLLEPWRWQQFTELTGKGCRCVTEDKNGSFWFGVNGGALSYNGSKWQFYPFRDDFSQSSVVSILAASDGTIYAGTS